MERFFIIIFFMFLASPVAAQNTIELVTNVQRPGGDYTSFQAINAGDCAQKCEESSRCQAFDFHKSDSSCWLKDRVYQSRPYQGVISGSKKFRQQRKTKAISSTMVLSFDTHRPGGDYARFHAQNQQACAENCSKDPTCIAFDFTMVDSMCYMKNWEPPASPYQGVISGVKRKKISETQRSSEQISNVQRILTEQGYNPGPVDGRMGKRTRVALRNYQRDYDLPVTGRIDQLTRASIQQQPSPTPPKPASDPAPTSDPEPNSGKTKIELSPERFSTISRD